MEVWSSGSYIPHRENGSHPAELGYPWRLSGRVSLPSLLHHGACGGLPIPPPIAPGKLRLKPGTRVRGARLILCFTVGHGLIYTAWVNVLAACLLTPSGLSQWKTVGSFWPRLVL